MTLGPRQQLLIDLLMNGGYTRLKGLLCIVKRSTGKCSYCAVGLAMETARVNGARIFMSVSTNEEYDIYDYDSVVDYNKTRTWYGMTEDALTDIMFLNDVKNMSFKKIAKYMLRNPDMFFEKVK